MFEKEKKYILKFYLLSEEFYVFVSSEDSLEHFGDNSGGQFRVQFPRTYNMKDKWECGLLNVSFINSSLPFTEMKQTKNVIVHKTTNSQSDFSNFSSTVSANVQHERQMGVWVIERFFCTGVRNTHQKGLRMRGFRGKFFVRQKMKLISNTIYVDELGYYCFALDV
jgi:hypothetical protein